MLPNMVEVTEEQFYKRKIWLEVELDDELIWHQEGDWPYTTTWLTESTPPVVVCRAVRTLPTPTTVNSKYFFNEDYLTDPEEEEDELPGAGTPRLKELVDALAAAKAVTCAIVAYGSGDDGCIDDGGIEITYVDAEAEKAAEQLEFDDLIEAAFEEKGFNYFDGDGGELQLYIEVAERRCNWTASYTGLILDEDASNEEIV